MWASACHCYFLDVKDTHGGSARAKAPDILNRACSTTNEDVAGGTSSNGESDASEKTSLLFLQGLMPAKYIPWDMKSDDFDKPINNGRLMLAHAPCLQGGTIFGGTDTLASLPRFRLACRFRRTIFGALTFEDLMMSHMFLNFLGEEVIGTAARLGGELPHVYGFLGREGTSVILEDTIPELFGEVQRFEAWVFSDRVEG